MPRVKADQRFTFIQEIEGDDWRTEVNGNTVTVCNSGIRDYVGLPDDLQELDIIFSVKKPKDGGWFKMEPQTNNHGHKKIGITTRHALSWYSMARHTMEHMYAQGFRFIRLEYTT